ncbi:uncharacterized protein [Procambarus clarkii]|uniref:uncharacterized protein n=1 Tax=Procambarus clarkii TaxID=6728 RepID=UPI003743C09A
MDDGNRWVPVIRYTAQSTLNSGAESTRRTISFLDHGRGLSTNGCSSARSFYSSTNSRSPSRSPSTITKDCGKRSTARARSATTTYLLPGDPTLPHRVAKTGNNHVQFITPDNEVTEMEPTAVETSSHQCLPLNSENSIISPVHDPIETVTSITAPREVPSLSGIVYMTAPREVSSLSGIASTSRGPEATPLIGQESPEESNRY